MIGNVIGGAHEIVKGEDQRAVPRMDDEGPHRKVLVPVCLAGSQIARGGHDETAIRLKGRYSKRCPPLAHANGLLASHIGEDPAKTNAIEPMQSIWAANAAGPLSCPDGRD